MNQFTIILGILFSIHAHAQVPANSTDDAASFCEGLDFKTDECMAIVSKADYFQKSLVALCGHLAGVEDDKISCIKTMANKYVQVERMVTNCDKKMFWSGEKECITPLLKTYQAPAATPTPSDTAPTPAACNKEKAKSKLESAIDQLKKLKYLELYESLMDLKYMLRDCGF